MQRVRAQKIKKNLTNHSDREKRSRLQILDHTLGNDPDVIFPRDLEILSLPEDFVGLLLGRVQQYDPGLAVDEVDQILALGPKYGAEQSELEAFLALGHSLSNGLHEVVVSCYLGGNHAELMPLVALEDAQHGRALVLDRGCELQVQAAL